jgi:putative transposase
LRGESFGKEVKAQSILGTEGFVERLIDYVRGHEEIPEIPKAQRYLNRPGLGQLLGGTIPQDIKKRNKKIEEAVKRYGYTQREVGDHLGMHFTSISRIMRERKGMLKK